MNCPGSNILLDTLALPETEEESWTTEGTAMHAAAAACLNDGVDAWEMMHRDFGGVAIDAEMADGVQVYLDYVRPIITQASAHWVEFPISSPVHELFYGTLDFGALALRMSTAPGACPPRFNTNVVRIVDLKGGKGIVVEVEDNPQLKYYAFGLIDAHPEWPDEMPVILAICQPRIDYHPDGMIREWETTVGEIREWVHDTLVPAMQRAQFDRTLDAGSWCRFCPAKLACPLLTSLFKAAATHNPAVIPHLSDENLGRDYQLREAVKFYLTAQEAETQRRMLAGREVPGAKLVRKKSNRILPPAAQKTAVQIFGDAAYKERAVKSPPELEKLGEVAREFVKENAYSPDTGLTVALESDTRPAVKLPRASDTYAEAAAKAGGTT